MITEERHGERVVQNANALFLGTPLSRYYSPESRRDLLDRGGYEDAPGGRFIPAEGCLVTRDGRELPALLHALPELDIDGRVCGARAMHLDISANKEAEREAARLEKALIESRKMEAIGTLAGGMVHDCDNILSAVIGYSQLTLMEARPGSRLHHNQEQILTAGMRARDHAGQIPAFGRQQTRELKSLQPGALVKEALKMLRASPP